MRQPSGFDAESEGEEWATAPLPRLSHRNDGLPAGARRPSASAQPLPSQRQRAGRFSHVVGKSCKVLLVPFKNPCLLFLGGGITSVSISYDATTATVASCQPEMEGGPVGITAGSF